MTSDLKLAKIYISVFNKDSTLEDVEYKNIVKERNKIRYELGLALRTKYVPKIKFFKDDTLKNVSALFDLK